MWGLAQLGDAAEGLKKILEFAETIEDRVERARLTNFVEQIYVLYFSPHLTKSVLEQIVAGKSLDLEQRHGLWDRLLETERPVRTALGLLDVLAREYTHVLKPEQRESLRMISYGKIEIRRMLRELLHAAEHGRREEARTIAARLLDDIDQINSLMNRTVSNVRGVVQETPRIARKGVRLSFWLVFVVFVALWVSVSLTVIVATKPALEFLRNLAN